jgi:hypothetical protein
MRGRIVGPLSLLRGWFRFIRGRPRLAPLQQARGSCEPHSFAALRLGSYDSFFFTRTTVIFAKPSSKAGAFSLAAIRRITSSGTT